MKLFLNLIILGTFFIGCSDDTATKSKNNTNIETEVVIRDSIAYEKFSNTPFSGRGLITDKNDYHCYVYKVDFLNGIPHGNFERWTCKGALLEKQNFLKGILNGRYTSWDESTGAVVSEKNYVNGQIISGWVLNMYEGAILSNLKWIDGKKNGIEKYNEDYPCDKAGELKYSKFSDGKFIGCAKKTNLNEDQCSKKIDKYLAVHMFDENFKYICVE